MHVRVVQHTVINNNNNNNNNNNYNNNNRSEKITEVMLENYIKLPYYY